MEEENQEEIIPKEEEEDEYIDKIKYLGKDMSKTLEKYQKELWIRTIIWYMLADNIKDKILDFIEKKLKVLDITIIILAALGVITNSIQMNFYLNFTIIKSDNNYSINIEGKSSNLIEAFRFITSISTLIIIILIIFHYQIKKIFLIFKHEIPINSSMFSRNLMIPMIVEIIFLLIHTPPFFNDMVVNYNYSYVNNEEIIPIYVDLFISAFILTRVFLFFKFYANYSKWGGVLASMVCSECNAKGGFIFTYRAGIKEHTFSFVFVFMIFTILIFGYALRNAEISFVRYVPEKYFQDWTRISNGFWFMTTNILLLGYGDYYPTTVLGRIIAFITMIWGIILEGFLIKAILNCIKMDSKEDIKDELFKQKKYYFNKIIWKTKKILKQFSKMRKNKEKKEKEKSVQNLMKKINLEINDNTNYLYRNIQTQINTLLENMNQAQENQNQIQLFTNILEVLHNNMNNKVKERTKSNGQVPIMDDIKNNKNKYKEKSANKPLIENIENDFKRP